MTPNYGVMAALWFVVAFGNGLAFCWAGARAISAVAFVLSVLLTALNLREWWKRKPD